MCTNLASLSQHSMDFCGIFLQLILAWAATGYLLTLLKRSKLNPKRQPPGPFPLPLVGNLFSLGSKPHKSLTELAKVYGPAMLLKVGCTHTLVVSSPSMAREVLKTNDAVFADRSPTHAVTALDHHLSSVGILPANARWRLFRRICATEVFANSRLDATQGLRRKKIQDLVSYVQRCCSTGEKLNIGLLTLVTSLNSLSNTFFSLDLVNLGSENADELKELIWSITKVVEAPNIADFFPILKMVDPQGIKRQMTVHFGRLIQIFDNLIKERLELRKQPSGSCKNDVLDALLNLCDEDNEFHLSDIPHLLIDLFVAGSDTTSITIEWAMAELLRNPEKMKKAQSELNEVIGTNNRVDENDHLRLPYLRAVVKETFRKHPPAPFLVPRKISTDVKLSEFTVPKDSKVLINVWAMGRDPSLWPNAEEFEPERFMGSPIDYGGQDYELIPFGSGRRMCPGIPLVNRVLYWMLGSLIHSVNWKLEDGMKPESVDLDDKFGLSVQKVQPLVAIPAHKEI